MGGYTRWSEVYSVTLTDRCSFLCVSGERGTISKSMHEEHLCVVALTSMERGTSSFRLPLTSLCDCLLLFVYFQVNNGVVYLDYEDSTSSWSSVLVSMIVLDSFLLSDDVLFCLCCFSGVPAWRLM